MSSMIESPTAVTVPVSAVVGVEVVVGAVVTGPDVVVEDGEVDGFGAADEGVVAPVDELGVDELGVGVAARLVPVTAAGRAGLLAAADRFPEWRWTATTRRATSTATMAAAMSLSARETLDIPTSLAAGPAPVVTVPVRWVPSGGTRSGGDRSGPVGPVRWDTVRW
jgi:hypothetical protein